MLFCFCRAVSALVGIEVEGGTEGGVSSDEQSGGAPRAQRRVQDAHCTAKRPLYTGSQVGMAARCGTLHTQTRGRPVLETCLIRNGVKVSVTCFGQACAAEVNGWMFDREKKAITLI